MDRLKIAILLLCFLLLSPSLIAGEVEFVTSNSSYLSLWITSIDEGEMFYFTPVVGGEIHYALTDTLSLGCEVNFQDQGLNMTSVYGRFRLLEPMGNDIWTSFQLGLSHLRYLDQQDDYRGLFFGANMGRFFREKWSAHTNIKISLFPGLLVPSYELGFQYYFTSFMTFNITYRGYDLKKQGVTIGTTLYYY